MPNTTITQFGLDYASSASPVGTLIAPVYWVPVYDPRIDSLIHDSVIPVSAFSACVNVSATAPTGEIIWNVYGNDEYSLSDVNDNFIIKGATTSSSPDPIPTGGTEVIHDPIQSQKWQINLKNGVPLSDHYHGTAAAFDPAIKVWDMSGCTISAGSNPTPSGKEKFFQVIDYYPVSADTVDSKLRGMVKCRLAKNIGDVKFNKVALYIEKYNSSGVESPDDPVFFAEAQLKTTVVKTSMGATGFDDMTVDVQIDLHSISANWNDVFFSTSGDYWSRVPDGLYYPERIGIGSFTDSILSPQASLHARRTRAMVSLGLTDAPVARFDYDDNNYLQIDVTSAGIEHHRYYSDTSSFDIIYDPDALSFYPEDTNTVEIGSTTNRFSKLYLGALGIDIQDSASDGYMQSYFNVTGGWIKYTDNIRMEFAAITGDTATEQIAYIQGADIRSTERSLINYTVKNDLNDNDLCIISDIDGGDTSWSDDSIPTGQSGVTHKNIMWQIQNATNYNWMRSDAKLRLYGRGEIVTLGPISMDSATIRVGTTLFDYGMSFSRKTKVLMAAGVTTTPYDVMSNVYNNLWTSMSLSTGAQFVMLGAIQHMGNITPVITNEYYVGQPGLYAYPSVALQPTIKYKKIFTTSIGAYETESYAYGVAYNDARVDTIFVKDIGLATDNSTSRVSRIALSSLLNMDAMDIGYISSNTTTGDTAYPTTYTAFNGLWAKKYLTLGTQTDLFNSIDTTNPSQYMDGGVEGRTIWQAYINNIKITHEIDMVNQFKIIGQYTGKNDGVTGVNLYAGLSDASDWPGIHKLGNVPASEKLTLGDGRAGKIGYIDSIYAAYILADSITCDNIRTTAGASVVTTERKTLPIIAGTSTYTLTYNRIGNLMMVSIPRISGLTDTEIRPNYSSTLVNGDSLNNITVDVSSTPKVLGLFPSGKNLPVGTYIKYSVGSSIAMFGYITEYTGTSLSFICTKVISGSGSTGVQDGNIVPAFPWIKYVRNTNTTDGGDILALTKRNSLLYVPGYINMTYEYFKAYSYVTTNGAGWDTAVELRAQTFCFEVE